LKKRLAKLPEAINSNKSDLKVPEATWSWQNPLKSWRNY